MQPYQYIRMAVDIVVDLELDQPPEDDDDDGWAREERIEAARVYLATYYLATLRVALLISYSYLVQLWPGQRPKRGLADVIFPFSLKMENLDLGRDVSPPIHPLARSVLRDARAHRCRAPVAGTVPAHHLRDSRPEVAREEVCRPRIADRHHDQGHVIPARRVADPTAEHYRVQL